MNVNRGLSLKTILVSFFLSISSSAPLFAILVKLPSEHVLEERISSVADEHFVEKTNLAHILANQEKEANGVAIAVYLAIERYKTYIKDALPSDLALMVRVQVEMQAPLIIRSILVDYPAAIEELEKEGILKPDSRRNRDKKNKK